MERVDNAGRAKECVPVPRSHTAGQRISSKDAVTWKPLCLPAGETGEIWAGCGFLVAARRPIIYLTRFWISGDVVIMGLRFST